MTPAQPDSGKAAVDGEGGKASPGSATTAASQSHSQKDDSTVEVVRDVVACSNKDVWSVAYREAVERLDEEKREMVLKGDRVDQLFRQLGDHDAESVEESSFRRGLTKLHQPLQNIKLAVDLASPLLGLEPAVATATGAVKSFTIVSGLPQAPNPGTPLLVRFRYSVEVASWEQGLTEPVKDGH